jgi:hypothetical protein
MNTFKDYYTKKPGRPAKADKKLCITIKLPPWLREKLQDETARYGLSQAVLIERALLKFTGWSNENV